MHSADRDVRSVMCIIPTDLRMISAEVDVMQIAERTIYSTKGMMCSAGYVAQTSVEMRRFVIELMRSAGRMTHTGMVRRAFPRSRLPQVSTGIMARCRLCPQSLL